MLRAVLFDLDDTLYRELDFVASALDAVARAASDLVPFAQLSATLRVVLAEEGRGRTIDEALRRCGVADDVVAARVPALVAVYRGHRPEHLMLHGDAARCLRAMRASGLVLGVVTDGDPRVQRAKVAALGLGSRVEILRYTWDAGAAHQKPHPDAYQPALSHLASLGIAPRDTMYVGDNPTKDFVGARALGMRTVRLRRGPHAALEVPPALEADVSITSLDALIARVQAA